MKKVILSAMAALVMTTGAAFADTTKFYAKESGQWTVEGIKDGALTYCAASTFWDNGSFFTFYITSDKKANIIIHDSGWNITDPVGHFDGYTATFNFFGKYSPFQGTADYELQDAQTIVIPNVTVSFFEQWTKYDVLNIIMPGSVTKVDIGLKGTSDAVSFLGDCINRMENKSSTSGQPL